MSDALPERWRVWLAENLIRGVPHQDLVAPLLAEGYAEEAVRAELAAADAHPYLAAGRRVQRALARRDWLLGALDALRRLDPERLAPERLERRPLPDLATFVREHYAPSAPAVFADVAAGWPAQAWTPADLAARFGEVEVEVQAGREQDPLYELRSDRHKQRMPLADFVQGITRARGNDLYLTANNAGANRALQAELFRELGPVGELLDMTVLPAGAFLWLGPAGVVTPLHHDLTNNLVVQLFGRKRFLLIPALQVPWLYNFQHVYSQVDLRDPDLERFPDLARVTPLEVVLEPGDALFLPLAWWHWVEGLSVSISLSFTNFALPNSYPRAAEPLEDTRT
ncbi:MAG: cupin-like domain-containing protein [Planctomycetota bacterium]